MNLNKAQNFSKIDREDMYQHIQDLPHQLEIAWRLGLEYELPRFEPIDHVLIAGMGGSAIGADLLVAYLSDRISVPISVLREYTLPSWARSQRTLLVTSSHSGNTEETISIYEQAKRYQMPRLAVSTGGYLVDLAEKDAVPVWRFEHQGQPRAAVGYSFGLLLALMFRLNLIANPYRDLQKTIEILETQKLDFAAGKSIIENSAKQLALRMADKMPVIFGADHLAPVARRWKGQINELAKGWAQFEALPEADHNTLAGTRFPKVVLAKMKFIFLSSSADHPRNQLRIKFTAEALEKMGLDVEVVQTKGTSELESMWSSLQFGDYSAYYLALLNNIDPTPIEIMNDLKRSLKNYSNKAE